MIYPKGVVDFVCQHKELYDKFADHISDHYVNTTSKLKRKDKHEFEKWLIKEGYQKSYEIRRYLNFLVKISKIFNDIYQGFKRINPDRVFQKDYNVIQISPWELLFIARYIYYLNSYGIEGDVIECGSFKGFSASCLSWVCYFLGKKLIIVDSFQGLPKASETIGKKTYYHPHDFKAEFKEVMTNITQFGKMSSVEFVKGWYHQSLRNFGKSICLLWMDVDLYKSAKDILINIFGNLSKGGVIFSHEFSKIAVDRNYKIVKSKYINGPPRAIADFLDSNNINYKAKYLRGDLGIIIPYIGDEERILLSPSKQNILEYYTAPFQFDPLHKFVIFNIKKASFFSLFVYFLSKNYKLRFLYKIGYFLSRFG